VNKVNSKVTIRWNIAASRYLSEQLRAFLLRKLSSKLTKEGELIVQSSSSRNQKENEEQARKKIDQIVAQALRKEKPRIATKPKQIAREKRVQSKKARPKTKALRKRPAME